MIAFFNWLINFDLIVCNAQMKIFVLFTRNISFIFIIIIIIITIIVIIIIFIFLYLMD